MVLTIALLLLYSFDRSLASLQPGANCVITDVNQDAWNTVYIPENAVDDNAAIFLNLSTTNVLDVTVAGAHAQYVSAEMIADRLVVKPTDRFLVDYETNENSVYNPRLTVELGFRCEIGTGTLTYYQDINDINNHNPNFLNPEYVFKIPMPFPPGIPLDILGGESIVAEDIDISNLKVDFSIDSDDFEISYDGLVDGSNKRHRAKVVAKHHIWFRETTEINLVVTDQGKPQTLSGTAKLVIDVDELAISPPIPTFTKHLFEATYRIQDDGKHLLENLDPITLEESYDPASVAITLQGDHQDIFKTEYSAPNVIIGLNEGEALPSDFLESHTNILLVVGVEVAGSEKAGATVLEIKLPEKECEEVTTSTATACTSSPPATTCPPCSTEPPLACTTQPSAIVTCPEPSCPPCTTTSCPITTEQIPCTCPSAADCPTVCPTPGPSLSTCPTCPDCGLTSTSVYCPTTTEAAECSCSPATVCPTPNPSLSTCPTCPDCGATEAPDSSFEFDKDLYRGSLSPTETGVIKRVMVVPEPYEDVRYQIKPFSHGSIPSQLQFDEISGEMRLSQPLDSGVYYFEVYATGLTSGKVADSKVVIYVSCKEDDCSDGARSDYAIFVKHVTEEENANEEILPLSNVDYQYEILDQYPETNPSMFEILESTGALQTTRKIDREAGAISNMVVSQYIVKVGVALKGQARIPRMANHSALSHHQSYDVGSEREWITLPGSLSNVDDVTVVAVLVDDINDNSPEFVQGSKITVGYPVEDLVEELSPPYLTVVQATDRDVGENAAIKYSTNSTYFLVNEVTGVIYPNFNSANEAALTEVFTVTATDRNGQGLSSSLTVQIRPLNRTNLIVLHLKNSLLEDAETKLNQLSAQTSATLKLLTGSVVPQGTSSSTRTGSDHTLKLVVYGIDSEEQLIEADELKKDVDDQEASDVESAELLADGGSDQRDCFEKEEPESAGYIAAIIVLAFLSAGLLLVTFIVYFKLRSNKPYGQMEEETTSSIFEKNLRASAASVNKFDSQVSHRRPTGFSFQSPPVEGEEDEFGHNEAREVKGFVETAFDYASETGFDVVDSDRRKSVTFNEMVQKINILEEKRESIQGGEDSLQVVEDHSSINKE